MRRKILIIDDDRSVREMMAEVLSFNGYDCQMAEGGKEGLGLFSSERNLYGLIFVDMVMDGMDGRETYKEIRKLDPNIPVVLSTGWELQEETSQLLKEGVSQILKKPFPLEKLLEIVRNYLV